MKPPPLKKPAKKASNKWAYIFLALPILIIATCNFYLNTHQTSAIIEDYQVGDYFVFSGFDETNDLPFKIKDITAEEVTFLVPQYEILNFDLHESPRKVYELEEKGEMYSGAIISVPVSQMNILKNGGKSISINGQKIRLEGVFGDHRENKVDKALDNFLEAVGEK